MIIPHAAGKTLYIVKVAGLQRLEAAVLSRKTSIWLAVHVTPKASYTTTFQLKTRQTKIASAGQGIISGDF